MSPRRYKPYGLSRREREGFTRAVLEDPTVPLAPRCPRCDTYCSGKPGGWWCGECSAPVTGR